MSFYFEHNEILENVCKEVSTRKSDADFFCRMLKQTFIVTMVSFLVETGWLHIQAENY